MNLFGLLFLQYRDGKKKSFASWWMDWHGRVFLGTPEDKGLDVVREDLRRSYYWRQADRLLPTDRKGLHEWQEDSMLVAQFRRFEAPAAAKVVSMVCLMVVLGLVAVGGVVKGTKVAASMTAATASKAQSGLARLLGGSSDKAEESGVDASDSRAVAWCKDATSRLGTMGPQEMAIVLRDPRWPTCDALLEANP